MKPEDLINWRELSRYLAGNGGSIYRKRIPQKHADNIENLKSKIQEWISEQE